MATGTVVTGQVEASTAPTADEHVLRLADVGSLVDGGSLASTAASGSPADGVGTVVYTGAGGDTETLPDASGYSNRLIVFKNAGADFWTLSGDLYDASLTASLILQPGDAVGVRSDGSRWLVLWLHLSLGSAS